LRRKNKPTPVLTTARKGSRKKREKLVLEVGDYIPRERKKGAWRSEIGSKGPKEFYLFKRRKTEQGKCVAGPAGGERGLLSRESAERLKKKKLTKKPK